MIFTKPTSIHGSITEHCNLRCRNCDWWKLTSGRSEATIEQWTAFVKELRAWLGPFDFHLAGGEPFLKKGLLELITAGAKEEVKVFVTSNGTMIDQSLAARLAESGIWCLNISLDFPDRDRQDWLKGVAGTANRIHTALDLIDQTRNGKYHVALATVIMKQNLRDLPNLVELARSRGYYIGFQVIFQNFGAKYDPQWRHASEFWPDDLGLVHETMAYLESHKASSDTISNSIQQIRLMERYFTDPTPSTDFECRVGDKMLAFNPYGDLALCFNTEPIGAITDGGIRRLWYGLTAQRRRRQIRKCRRQCALLNCHFEE